MNGLVFYSCFSWCFGAWLMLSHRTDQKLGNAKGRFGLAAVSRVRQIMILLSPFLLPVIAVMWVTSFVRNILTMRKLSQFTKQHRDPEHIPVNFLHLNKQTQSWFKLQTPEFFSLGFEMVGDFRYRTEPFEIISRHFRSSDGTVIGSLIAMNGTRCAIEMSSIDQHGVYLGTCTVGDESLGEPISAERISIKHISLQPIEDVLSAHQDRLKSEGNVALGFDISQVEAVLRYGSRCMSEWKFRSGHLTSEPPAPELPDALHPTT